MSAKRDATNTDRWAYAQSLRDAGHTLEAIGQELGVTRQRIQQKISVRPKASCIDPIALLRVVRDPSVTSLATIQSRLMRRVHSTSIATTLRELSLHAAVLRLFRWRREAPTRRRYAALIMAEARRLGRTPAFAELDVLLGIPAGHAAPKLANTFGSCRAMWRYCGLVANSRGTPSHQSPRQPSPVCRRGHDKLGRSRCPVCGAARSRKAYHAKRVAAASASRSSEGAEAIETQLSALATYATEPLCTACEASLAVFGDTLCAECRREIDQDNGDLPGAEP